MAKKMLIDATHPEELRVVVADGNKVEEFDFESMSRRQLAGNIYLAKVTRVEPSLQAAFVDYGGNRHGFLAFSEIHPDYYQIPKADRDALLAEEQAEAEAAAEEDEKPAPKAKRSRSRSRSKSKPNGDEQDAVSVTQTDVPAQDGDTTAPDTPSEQPAPASPSEDPAPASPAETPVPDVPLEAPVSDPVEIPDQSAPAGNDTPTSMAEDTGMEDAEITSDDASAGDDDAPAADRVSNPAPARSASVSGMDVVELDDDAQDDDAGRDDDLDAVPAPDRAGALRGRKPTAAEKDPEVESISDDDDDDFEEVRAVRKPIPRARKYKIQEVVKVRQIMLVQVVKEERGNKGAALTTYLSLAGRYCVLMPNTARGGGISRKITNAPDRKKLKEIATEIDVPKGAGLIIRTAGAKRTKTEIKRDYEYLQRQWEQIRELTLKSIAPAPIYEEGNLIRRSIRDLYNRDIDEVIVEGEAGYRHAKDFMKMIMPSHAKNVKLHTEPMPLFARHQVESYLSGMFNPTVQLKSGGYIVIGVTEALVAIDVNSGKATKEGSIEETATKTNLEAADEVARQLRLRDLAGLIVIDFIDMDDRRNNAAVEKRIKDALKLDRARIQIGRISGFGLLEMSRQRLRPGMLEATTQPCPACHGTGLIRSDDSLALSILRTLEEEGTRNRSKEVLLKLPVDVANYIMNDKREHLAGIELRYEMAVRIMADPHLIAPDYEMEKFKVATRVLPKVNANVVSMDSSYMDDLDEDIEDPVDDDDVEDTGDVSGQATPSGSHTDAAGTTDGAPKKKRRRRSRRSKGNGENGNSNGNGENGNDTAGSADDAVTGEGADSVNFQAADAPAKADVQDATAAPEASDDAQEKPPAKTSRSRSRSKPKPKVETAPEAETAPEPADTAAPVQAAEADTVVEPDPKPKPKPRSRAKAPAKEAEQAAVAAVAEAVQQDATVTEAQTAPEVQSDPQPQVAVEPEDAAAKPEKKRGGWWSLKR